MRDLARLQPGVRRERASTWDRSGGNDDRVSLSPGETVVLAEGDGPGQVTHLWCTVAAADLWWPRQLVLRCWWDGSPTPSVEVPLGDFFGMGDCFPAVFSSAALEAAPRDGLGLTSWFPMPYSDGFRVAVTNEGPLPVAALYCYVDHERWPEPRPGLGRFHARWSRTRATEPPAQGRYAPAEHASTEGNHVLLRVRGQGHYVGATMHVRCPDGGWWGEGDDMIVIDDEPWPPRLHGTGTEDYVGTAWSPATAFSSHSSGHPVAEHEDWSGHSSFYRLHLHDPVQFDRSVEVSVERGHANDRRDDWSSVAYFYLDGIADHDPLPPVEQRAPSWSPDWVAVAHRVREVVPGVTDPGRASLGIAYLMRQVAARDLAQVRTALDWLTEAAAPAVGDLRPVLQEYADVRGPSEQRLVVGVETATGHWQLREDAVVVDGEPGPERLTVTASPEDLRAWLLGGADGWELALRGRLGLAGDTSMAPTLPLHPSGGPGEVAPEPTAGR